jgi:hypothetical protein
LITIVRATGHRDLPTSGVPSPRPILIGHLVYASSIRCISHVQYMRICQFSLNTSIKMIDSLYKSLAWCRYSVHDLVRVVNYQSVRPYPMYQYVPSACHSSFEEGLGGSHQEPRSRRAWVIRHHGSTFPITDVGFRIQSRTNSRADKKPGRPETKWPGKIGPTSTANNKRQSRIIAKRARGMHPTGSLENCKASCL